MSNGFDSNDAYKYGDDDAVFRRYIEEQSQQSATRTMAEAQQAMVQAQQNSAVFGSGQVQIPRSFSDNPWGTSASSGLIFNTQGSMYSYSGALAPTFQSPTPRPYSHAEDLINGLRSVDPEYIKEIVVVENVYMEFVGMLGYDVEKNPDIIKSLQYHLPYGIILLRNEKYQIDLDKYMENGPTAEMVKE